MPSASRTSGTGFSSKNFVESCGQQLETPRAVGAAAACHGHYRRCSARAAAFFHEKFARMELQAELLRQLKLYAALLRLEPPAPARAKMRQTRNTQMTMLAVSPWMEPMPKSQYQWMPTLGGSPARAGKGAADKAAAAAAVAACFGAGASTERKAVFHTNSAARAAKLSSCGARRPAMSVWED